jgi:hypothetical protein
MSVNGDEGEGSDFDQGAYEEHFNTFEEMGEPRLRSELERGTLPQARVHAAWEWLKRRERDRTQRTERRAKNAEYRANLAIIISVLSFVGSLVIAALHT